MTFLEAAIEVLKREGKPLHFKELTQLAVKHKLLSVVGRDPETAMKAQLQAASLRSGAELLLVRPEVFGLRAYPARTSPTSKQSPKSPQPEGKRPSQERQMPAKESPPKAKEAPRKKSKPQDKPGEQQALPLNGDKDAGKPARRGQKKSAVAEKPAAVVVAPAAEAKVAAAPPPPAPAAEQHAEEPSGRRRRGGRAHAPRPSEKKPAPSSDSGRAAEPSPKAVPAVVEVQPPPAPAAAAPPLAQAVAPESAQTPVVTPARPTEESGPAEPARQEPVAKQESTKQEPAARQESAKQEPATKQEPAPRLMALGDAAFDVLRGSSDGRPMHFRQIADIALKRRLVRGEAADLWRALRTAIIRDGRQRDMDGLRPRVRTLGQGQYTLADRKLEQELVTAERELIERLSRTREATRVALRRRLKAMPASAFELLMRLLLERLGMINAELMKRGEGVSYYAGTISRGARTAVKVLCAIRPGEGEVGRDAIGELRAGVRLRSFDEGLLLCSGRAGAAALAETNAASGIEIYDQEPLTDLLIRHQLGVRRLHLPIEYLDLELLADLIEPAT